VYLLFVIGLFISRYSVFIHVFMHCHMPTSTVPTVLSSFLYECAGLASQLSHVLMQPQSSIILTAVCTTAFGCILRSHQTMLWLNMSNAQQTCVGQCSKAALTVSLKMTTMCLHSTIPVGNPITVELLVILMMASTVHSSKNNDKGKHNSNIVVCRRPFLKEGLV